MQETIENVKPLRDIVSMSYNQGRIYLMEARNNFPTSQLIAHWKKTAWPQETIYGSKVYKVFEKFDIPVATERTRKAHEVRSKKLSSNQENKNTSTAAKFTISLEGEWTGKNLAERMASIANLLNSDIKYKIKIDLQEARD